MEKKIVYVDMDNVLVDFRSGIMKIDHDTFARYDDRLDEDVVGDDGLFYRHQGFTFK